jgi:hypothetical protein
MPLHPQMEAAVAANRDDVRRDASIIDLGIGDEASRDVLGVGLGSTGKVTSECAADMSHQRPRLVHPLHAP